MSNNLRNIFNLKNAVSVILILLAISCSSNWKVAYLNTDKPRKLDAFPKNTRADNSNTIDLVEDNLPDDYVDPSLLDSTYKATDLNADMTVDRDGNVIGEINLQEIVITDRKTQITPVDTNGRLIISLTVEVPKDIIAPDWQMRLHPTIYLRQNKVEGANFPGEDIYITGSDYRDKQIAGYERYSRYLSKITANGALSYDTQNLSKMLGKDISEYVNKYQLEYFIMRNFPEVYSLKTDSTYISDEKFEEVLGADKDKIINHYYNKSLEKRISKLMVHKRKNFREWVYNPMDYENLQTDNLVFRDTLERFDKIYSEVLEKIEEEDSLSNVYYSYLDSVKNNARVSYPELISEKERFKLDKYIVVSGNDSSKVYLEYDYSTILNAFQYPNLDKIYIGITGDIYVDTTRIYNFEMGNRLEYPVISTANLADTTEILYDSIPQLRKANSNANYRIEFEKNSALLKEHLGSNETEIANIKKNLLSLLRNNEFDLDSIIVSATASPEGAISVNERFSGQRSQAVSNYFRNFVDSQRWKYKSIEDSLRQEAEASIASAQDAYDRGDIPKEDLDFIIDKFKKEIEAAKIPDIRFIEKPIPENWDDLHYLVVGDEVMSYEEKNKFYDVVEKYNNQDTREANMKSHSYYNYMSKELYPKIRVVKFEFHMHRKGQEMDTVWIRVPSEKYMEGVKALRGFDFIKAESILKNYPSYNAAICFIVRNKPLQAINILEDPSLRIDFEKYKIKRDSLTQLYVSADSSTMNMKDSIYNQIQVVKERMDRAAKIEFLKAKAYFMRRKDDDLNKSLKSYLFLIRMDKLNGLYSKAMTGEELKGGAIFGSSEYFIFTANTDEYLSALPKLRIFSDVIKKYEDDLAFELWKEKVKYFTPKEREEYNLLREAYMYDYETEEELERALMKEF